MKNEKYQCLKYINQIFLFSFLSIKIFFKQNFESQIQGLIEEKTRLENDYQKLNKAYEQNIIEQNDLLVLCSTYEDQLTTCRNIIQSAGLTVEENKHIL